MNKKYRKGGNVPLWLFYENRWIRIPKKKEFYRNSSVRELRGIIVAQQMVLSMGTQDAVSKRRIQQTIVRLKKGLIAKTKKAKIKKNVKR